MNARYAWMGLLILAVALCVSCGAEEATQEPAPPEPSGKKVPLLPPIVDLEPKEDNPQEFDWVKTPGGKQDQKGPSLFDPNEPDNYCKLREDFIGTKLTLFKFYDLQGSHVEDRELVELASADGSIVLTARGRSGGNGWNVIEWNIQLIEPSTGRVIDECSPLQKGGVTPGFVPAEFFNLAKDSLQGKQASNTIQGSNFEFRVM